MCTMALNNELNGVELYFESKPSNDVMTSLKDIGYRWHNKKKCWYAKQNDKTMLKANELSVNKTESIKVKSSDKEVYFPKYDAVGSTKIFKSSDKDIFNEHGGYFADENVLIEFYCNGAIIIDLSNALKTGKMCTRYSICNCNNSNRDYIGIALHDKNNIKTYKELIQAIKNNTALVDINIEKSEEKGIRTFSPFVKVKPIKTPKKWTISHLWKAILSGQIYRGESSGHYTDDYAYDAACNFGKGRSTDLIYFARELITSCSQGISIRGEQLEDGTFVISYSNYSFDYQTLYYDETCNLEEAQLKREKYQQEKENKNNKMLSQVIELKPSDIDKNSVYEISYLDLDCNSKTYSVRTKLVYSNCIFYENECNYQIVEFKKFTPNDRKIYTISNFSNRPYGDEYKDNRIIDMGNWEHIVTGYALKELLEEGKTFITIQEKSINIDKIKETLNKHIKGSIVWMAGILKDETDYQKSLYKLNAEELRIPEDDLCTIYQ